MKNGESALSIQSFHLNKSTKVPALILSLSETKRPPAFISARILSAAETVEPANDTASHRPWYALTGLAAMAVMAAFFFVQTPPEPQIDWEQIADGSGFTELYDWVEGEDG